MSFKSEIALAVFTISAVLVLASVIVSAVTRTMSPSTSTESFEVGCEIKEFSAEPSTPVVEGKTPYLIGVLADCHGEIARAVRVVVLDGLDVEVLGEKAQSLQLSMVYYFAPGVYELCGEAALVGDINWNVVGATGNLCTHIEVKLQ